MTDSETVRNLPPPSSSRRVPATARSDHAPSPRVARGTATTVRATSWARLATRRNPWHSWEKMISWG
jgi:hypothetical protein